VKLRKQRVDEKVIAARGDYDMKKVLTLLANAQSCPREGKIRDRRGP